MKKILVGKVYANWCGHCQKLKPEWEKMKKDLKSKMKKMGYLIQFVEIEDTEKDKLTKYPHLQVNGYPTIFKKSGGGQYEYYNGERSANKISKWVIEKKSSNSMYGGKTSKKNKPKSKTGKSKKSKTGKVKRKTIKNKTVKNKTMISKITSFFNFGKK